jgi:hypothetical protein
VLILLTAAAAASYISLNTSLDSKVDGKTLKALVTSVNKGDEPAYNVQAEIRLGNKVFLGAKKTELPVGVSYQVPFSLPLTHKLPGQYPLVLVMHYTDANQYPFSALSVQTYTYQTEPPPTEVFGRIRSATFWREGRMALTLKNLSNMMVLVKTKLVTPRELIVGEISSEVIIAPKAERHLDLPIENFSALSGSTYQLFAVAEYDKDNLHHTAVAPGMAKIVEGKSIGGIDYTYLVIILIALVIIFLLYQIFKK